MTGPARIYGERTVEPLRQDDPDQVGGYRLLARLGAGGMGVVYLGCSPGGRAVAVKVVRERFAGDVEYRARFRREVTAARNVTGTFTAPVLDAAPEAAAPWLVTAYLPGLSLREAVGAFGSLPPDTVRALAAGLAEALTDIHAAGLAHRDLKPGNIMLTAGGPRVIDFGIARPEDATAITRIGTVVGTPGFMSPEQVSGGVVGPAADVFSFGAVLVFASTGNEPFGSDAAARLAEPAQVGIEDPWLRDLVAECLRREPGRRPSAADLLNRLGEGATPGAGWLPAPIAEAIDRRAVPVSSMDQQVPGSAAPLKPSVMDEATVDPVISVPADAAGTEERLGRRRLIIGGAVVLAAAGGVVALARRQGSNRSIPTSTPTSAGSPSSSFPAPPPQAVLRWRVKVSDYYPDVFTTGGVVVASTPENDVYGLDARTGATLWTQTAGNGCEVLGDTVYLARPIQPWLTAADPASGATRWQASFSESSVRMAVAGEVVCFGYDTRTRAVGVGDGRSRWVADVTPKAGLAADAGLVAAVNATSVVGLDPGSGQTRWIYPLDLGETLLTALLVSDGLVFVGDRNGTLHALRADNGAVAWRNPQSPTWAHGSWLRSAGGTLYADGGRGSVVAMNAATGEQHWSRFLDADTELGLSGDVLLAACAGIRTVYGLDTADGRVRWTYSADVTRRSTPVGTAGLVFISTREGTVEALAPPDGATRAGS